MLDNLVFEFLLKTYLIVLLISNKYTKLSIAIIYGLNPEEIAIVEGRK